MDKVSAAEMIDLTLFEKSKMWAADTQLDKTAVIILES